MEKNICISVFIHMKEDASQCYTFLESESCFESSLNGFITDLLDSYKRCHYELQEIYHIESSDECYIFLTEF